MTRRTVVMLPLALLAAPLRAQQQNPPRLVADNRTDAFADIYAWNGSAWGFVSRVNPRQWVQFPNAANGSSWRAVIGQTVRDHVVRYVYDPGYNGWQDLWWIQ